MIRGTKNVDWSRYLEPSDIEIAAGQVDPAAWYPMETFERYGVAILAEVGKGQLMAVRMWGRFQLDAVLTMHPALVAPGSPRESLMRFQVLRRTLFDYDALDVVDLEDGAAGVVVAYGMSPVAEEAASHQTLGFFERLVETAGGQDVYARFRTRSWQGDRTTRLDLDWR